MIIILNLEPIPIGIVRVNSQAMSNGENGGKSMADER